jgi:hypothetical protein
MRLYGILLFLALSFANSSATSAAPANLLNKTITFSLTTSASYTSSDGKSGAGSRATTNVLYISSAGRIFAKRVRQDGRASEFTARAPGEHTWRFVGDKLVGVGSYVSGASQSTISFDPSGQSCTATIQFGRDSGRAMSWKGVNGITYTATSPWVASNISCSVAPGNSFAGQ